MKQDSKPEIKRAFLRALVNLGLASTGVSKNVVTENLNPDGEQETESGDSSDEHLSPRETRSQPLTSRYEFKSVFARGGLGLIRRAYDRKLEREVAVKELQDFFPNSAAEIRFLREARLTGRLEHPAIIPVHDIGRKPTGEPYYCMKLVDGRSFADLVGTKKTLRERIELLPHVIAVADALAYAHSRGVIHRDLKPQNVLVGPFGETVVIDWGLAKEFGVEDRHQGPTLENFDVTANVTQTGDVLGTLVYMPPEQALGYANSPGVDVYAIGAMLYFLLSGQPPYSKVDPGCLLQTVIDRPPTALEQLVPELEEDLLSIVKKAMARREEERYGGAEELASDLQRFLAGKMVAARAYSTLEILGHFARRYRVGLSVAGAIATVVAVIAIVSYSSVVESRNQALVSQQIAERERAAAEDEAERAERAKQESEAIRNIQEEGYFRQLVADGQRELFDNHQPLKALVPLSEAYKLRPGEPDLRMLIADAARVTEARLDDDSGEKPAGAFDMKFSPDGSTLAVLDQWQHVFVWNLHGWRQLADVEEAAAISFEPESERLVVLTSQMEVGIFDVKGRVVKLVRSVSLESAQHRKSNLGSVWSISPGLFAVKTNETNKLSKMLSESFLQGQDDNPYRLSTEPSLRVMMFSRDQKQMPRLQVHNWDLQANETSLVYRHPEFVFALPLVSASGRYTVLSGQKFGPDGEGMPLLDLIDTNTGKSKSLEPCAGNDTGSFFAAHQFSQDESTFFAFDESNDAVAKWNIRSGKCEQVFRASRGERLLFGPTGHHLITAAPDGFLRMRSPENFAVTGRVATEARVQRIQLEPTGKQVAIQNETGKISIWGLGDSRVRFRLTEIEHVASTGGMLFAVRNRGQREILLIDRNSSLEVKSLPAPAETEYILVRPALGHIFIILMGRFSQPIEIWKLYGGRVVGRVTPSFREIHAAEVFGEDSLLLCGSSRNYDDTCIIQNMNTSIVTGFTSKKLAPLHDRPMLVRPKCETSSSQYVSSWGHTVDLDRPGCGTFAGKYFIFNSPVTDTLGLYESDSGALIAQRRHSNGYANLGQNFPSGVVEEGGIGVSGSGRLIATAQKDGSIDIWQTPDLDLLEHLEGHTQVPKIFYLNPDEIRLVTNAGEGTPTYMWKLDHGNEGILLETTSATKISFDESGDYLATFNRARQTVQLWSQDSGRLLSEFVGPKNLRRLEFLGDGQILVLGDRELTILQIPQLTMTGEEVRDLAARIPYHYDARGVIVRK